MGYPPTNGGKHVRNVTTIPYSFTDSTAGSIVIIPHHPINELMTNELMNHPTNDTMTNASNGKKSYQTNRDFINFAGYYALN